jgi:hypothetical protein
MKVSKWAMTVLAVAAGYAAVCWPAMAQNTPAAQRVIDKARAATGGGAWNSLAGLHETGRQGEGRYEQWVDPVRYGFRSETTTSAGKVVQGYNGYGEWRLLADGTATGSVEEADLREIRSDAFFGAYGYFYPGRFDQRSSHLGARQSGGRTYEVLRIEPVGGEMRELWFDRRTGLLGVIVDEIGPRQSRTDLSDYRKAGAVSVPFKRVVYGRGETASLERTAEHIAAEASDRARFSLPPDDTP